MGGAPYLGGGKPYFNRLLKNAHLLCCAAPLVIQRTYKYASFLGSCAPCICTFLNSLMKSVFFNNLLKIEDEKMKKGFEGSRIQVFRQRRTFSKEEGTIKFPPLAGGNTREGA